jgi:uncharacterized protein (TIGR02246 family)
MNRLRARTAVFGLLSLFAFLAVWGIGWAGTAGQSPRPNADAAGVDRQVDRDAIRAMMKEFVAAFQKGDAAAAAAFMTVEAEIITDEGDALKGRDAIQKAYAEHFTKTSRPKVTLAIDSVRFTSRDTAIEDGEMTVIHDGESPQKHRYQILYAREDGKWLISLIKEWPPIESPLSELEWLIGTWSAKRADAEVRNTYEWFGNKSFIKVDITVREKDKSLSAMQLIGIDPVTGGIRTWTFEHDGGYGEGSCLQDGPRWVFENRTTLADGSILEATNILVPVDRNTITWQPINLTIEGEQFGDLPPVKITRVKK